MANMLRARRNHRQHTECNYGCCTNRDPNKLYRTRAKREAREQVKTDS